MRFKLKYLFTRDIEWVHSCCVVWYKRKQLLLLVEQRWISHSYRFPLVARKLAVLPLLAQKHPVTNLRKEMQIVSTEVKLCS